MMAQKTEDIVKWTASLDKAQSAILLSAEIKSGWVMYSQHTDPDGPIPLEFEFSGGSGLSVEGEVEELSKATKAFDEMFELEVIKFKGKADFRQKVMLTNSPATTKGYITFMCCDASKCLPPVTVELDIK